MNIVFWPKHGTRKSCTNLWERIKLMKLFLFIQIPASPRKKWARPLRYCSSACVGRKGAHWQASGWIFIVFLMKAKDGFCSVGWVDAECFGPTLFVKKVSVQHQLFIISVGHEWKECSLPPQINKQNKLFWIKCKTAVADRSEEVWAVSAQSFKTVRLTLKRQWISQNLKFIYR